MSSDIRRLMGMLLFFKAKSTVKHCQLNGNFNRTYLYSVLNFNYVGSTNIYVFSKLFLGEISAGTQPLEVWKCCAVCRYSRFVISKIHSGFSRTCSNIYTV